MNSSIKPKLIALSLVFLTSINLSAANELQKLQESLKGLNKSLSDVSFTIAKLSGPAGLDGLHKKLETLTKPVRGAIPTPPPPPPPFPGATPPPPPPPPGQFGTGLGNPPPPPPPPGFTIPGAGPKKPGDGIQKPVITLVPFDYEKMINMASTENYHEFQKDLNAFTKSSPSYANDLSTLYKKYPSLGDNDCLKTIMDICIAKKIFLADEQIFLWEKFKTYIKIDNKDSALTAQHSLFDAFESFFDALLEKPFTGTISDKAVYQEIEPKALTTQKAFWAAKKEKISFYNQTLNKEEIKTAVIISERLRKGLETADTADKKLQNILFFNGKSWEQLLPPTKYSHPFLFVRPFIVNYPTLEITQASEPSTKTVEEQVNAQLYTQDYTKDNNVKKLAVIENVQGYILNLGNHLDASSKEYKVNLSKCLSILQQAAPQISISQIQELLGNQKTFASNKDKLLKLLEECKKEKAAAKIIPKGAAVDQKEVEFGIKEYPLGTILKSGQLEEGPLRTGITHGTKQMVRPTKTQFNKFIALLASTENTKHLVEDLKSDRTKGGPEKEGTSSNANFDEFGINPARLAGIRAKWFTSDKIKAELMKDFATITPQQWQNISKIYLDGLVGDAERDTNCTKIITEVEIARKAAGHND